MTNNLPLITNRKKSSFTLIELLVVLALVAILSVVVVMTLNPAELLKQARDSNRLSDLATINTALNLFSTDVTSGFMGTSTMVYVSIPDSSSVCSNLGLPSLPTGYTYNCVTSANLRNTDGTGWIPVNFNRISSNSPISQLPIDPTNTTSSGNYYTYVTGGSWILTSIPESIKQKAELSNNPHLSKFPGVIAMGNNLDINPLYNPTGLVGYWKFDEGIGSVVKDSSGNNLNAAWAGTLGGQWAVGRVGSGSGAFNGIDVRAETISSSMFNIVASGTISSWVQMTGACTANPPCMIFSKGGPGWATLDYAVYTQSDNKFYGNISDGSNALQSTGSPTTAAMQLNRWYYATFTWDIVSQKATVYLDGKLANQKSTTIVPRSVQTGISIGRDYNYNDYYFPGLIDDVRLYNRALFDAEVLALYNATK